MKKIILFYATLSGALALNAQTNDEKDFVEACFNYALTENKAYSDLRYLCKNIGARLSGSEELEEAIQWADTLLNGIGADKIYLQDVTVPHWERGSENGYFYSYTGRNKLKLSALGGSVGTGNYKITGSVVKFDSLEDLEKADSNDVKGKMVFINKPFDETYINTFKAYSSCASQRFLGSCKSC